MNYDEFKENQIFVENKTTKSHPSLIAQNVVIERVQKYKYLNSRMIGSRKSVAEAQATLYGIETFIRTCS